MNDDRLPQRFTVELRCDAVMAPVLRRIAAMAGVQAGLTSERVGDIAALANALAEAACGEISDQQLLFDFDCRPGSVEIAVGPLESGAGGRLEAHVGDSDPLLLAVPTSLAVHREPAADHIHIGFAA